MSTTSSTEPEARGVVDQAGEKVHDAAVVAQEKASELAETGRSRLSEQLDSRTSEFGSQTRSVAGALRRGNRQLEADGEEAVAGVVVRAADGLDRIGSYLQQQTGDELLRDVEWFARRRPWLTAGVAMVAGVALSRFLKSSSEDRYRARAGGKATVRRRPGRRGLCPERFPRPPLPAPARRRSGRRGRPERNRGRGPAGAADRRGRTRPRQDLSLLFRQEVELAKAELREKAQLLVPGIAMFGGALVLALAVVGALTATLILVLATFLDDWLAALVAALVVGAIALALVQIGRARLKAAGKPVPEQTIETVKEDVEWAKTRATSARK